MDIDGDGRDDLLHVGVDGSLYFNLAQSSGGFGPDQQITFTPPRGDIFDWRAVNANGDAFNDLAVHTSLFIPMGGTNVEKFEVFRNTGSGFTSYARLGLGSTANGAFGDFNGDGLDDFVQIDDINPSNVYVSYNTGTGFAASQIHVLQFRGERG